MAPWSKRVLPGRARASGYRPRGSLRWAASNRGGTWCLVLLALCCVATPIVAGSGEKSEASRTDAVASVDVGDGSSSYGSPKSAPGDADLGVTRMPINLSNDDSLGGGLGSSASRGSDAIIPLLPATTAPLLVLTSGAKPLGDSDASFDGSSAFGALEVASMSFTGSVESGEDVSISAPPEEMHGVPSNPTLVNAVAFDRRAAVSWKAPDDDGYDPITLYEVGWFDEEDSVLVGTQKVMPVPASSVNAERLTNQNSSTADAGSGEVVPTSTVVGPLINGRSYTFKVRAQNANGFSVWSAKSLVVSPLHPPDLCERLSCSGHGTCFPNYHPDRPTDFDRMKHERRVLVTQEAAGTPSDAASNTAIDEFSLDALCICRPGYSPPDCSAKSNDETAQYVWQVSQWSECDSGCGGGRRARSAVCYDVAAGQQAPSEMFCAESKKPSLTGICNGVECGSKRVAVMYTVEMSYDEVLFSPAATEAFELAFTTEVAAALQIPRSRLEITALKRGSIAVFFQILPASRVREKSLNDIVENLQEQLDNDTSTLRSTGTFARRIEPNGVKLSFSIADQTVAGGAEDISIAGLVGTVFVLCFFVSSFGWLLRRRHYRILKQEDDEYERQKGAKRPTHDSSHDHRKRMDAQSLA